MHSSEYALNLKGAAMYALAQWRFWAEYRSQDEMDQGIRTGNMQAYSAMLEMFTGRKSEALWSEMIGVM